MPAKPTGDDDPIVIKKYANRRLYNTARSSYVTLENLAEMVRAGEDFVVRDAKSGEDITRSVLTQIIFEEEAKGRNLLPANFLRQLIRLYGDTLQGFVPGYLDTAMETFARNQERLREQVQQTWGPNAAMANFETLTRRNMELFENALRMFSPFGAASAAEEGMERQPEAGPPATAATSDELSELKSQLAAMQDQISKLSREDGSS